MSKTKTTKPKAVKIPDQWTYYRHRMTGHEIPLPFRPTLWEFLWCLYGNDELSMRQTLNGYPGEDNIMVRRSKVDPSRHWRYEHIDRITRYAMIRHTKPLMPPENLNFGHFL
jgi:hypothetical protein